MRAAVRLVLESKAENDSSSSLRKPAVSTTLLLIKCRAEYLFLLILAWPLCNRKCKESKLPWVWQWHSLPTLL